MPPNRRYDVEIHATKYRRNVDGSLWGGKETTFEETVLPDSEYKEVVSYVLKHNPKFGEE